MKKSQEPSRRQETAKRKWLPAFLCALVFHGACVILFFALTRQGLETQNQTTNIPVEMDELEPVSNKETDVNKTEEGPEKELPQTAESSEPTLRQKEKSPVPIEIDISDDTDSGAVKKTSSTDDLLELNLELSKDILSRVASQDGRIRRMLHKPEVTLFSEEFGPSKIDMPPGVPFEAIRHSVQNSWNPDWDQIKDDGISKISGLWTANEVQNFVLNWQRNQKVSEETESVHQTSKDMVVHLKDKESGKNRVVLPDVAEAQDYLDETDFAPNKVTVGIDVEPLRNGGYAISISKASGHPFFDRNALDEIKKVASNFPSWTAGYGHVMRYELDAQFTIIPPRPGNLVGLTCAFPFCSVDELNEIEVTHWFKKLLFKNVQFKGIIAPPAPVDAGF